MAENYINVFKDLGIDTRSADQIIEDKQKETQQAGLASLQATPQGEYPGARDLRMGGKAMGMAIASHFNKPKLTPQEQMMVDAQKYATATTDLMKEGGKFGSEENNTFRAVEYGETRMEKIAEYLLSKGDMRGMDMAARVYAARQVREKDTRERVKHDMDRERHDFDIGQDRWGFNREQFLVKRGEMATIYASGSDNPNEGVQAYIDDTGTALTRNAQGEYIPFQLGEYTLDRPSRVPEGKDGGRLPPPPPGKVEEMKAHQRAIKQQMELSMIAFDAFSNAMAASPTGSLDILDGAGKFQIFATNLANNVSTIFRQGEQVLGLYDGDPKDPNSKRVGGIDATIGGAQRYVRENKAFFDDPDLFRLPEGIVRGTREAERYQAAIVQLAYAKARSNEPGARQLSDADFKNAIKVIGAGTTDPESFRAVMMDNVNLADNDFEYWMKQYSPEMRRQLIHQDAMTEYDATKRRWEKKFDSFWGTAARPQGTLREEADRKRGGETGTSETTQNGDGTPGNPYVIRDL